MAYYLFPTRNNNCFDHVMLKSKNIVTTLVLDYFITNHASIIFDSALKTQTNYVKCSIKRLDD